MEELLKKVSQRKDGNQEAIDQLGLTNFEQPKPVERSNVSLKTLQKHYTIVSQVVHSASALGLHTLKGVCEEFLSILEFVGKFKLKKKLRWKVNRNDILQTMQVLVESFASWLKDIHENNGEVVLNQLHARIRRASLGDDGCLKLLKLDERPKIIVLPMTKVPKLTTLKLQYQLAQTLSTIGLYMNTLMQNINLGLMSYLAWMAGEAFPKQQISYKDYKVCYSPSDHTR